MMNKNFSEQASLIKAKILSLPSAEARYDYLIELGRKAPAYPESLKTPDRIVSGCQSVLYLSARFEQGALFFTSYSEALLSAGLAALLTTLYNGSCPQTILLNPPTFLQEIGLLASLSPSRSNGFSSLYLKMKQEAVKYILQPSEKQ